MIKRYTTKLELKEPKNYSLLGGFKTFYLKEVIDSDKPYVEYLCYPDSPKHDREGFSRDFYNVYSKEAKSIVDVAYDIFGNNLKRFIND